MDVLTLLDEARRVGVTVRTDGDRLIVRGKREHQAIIQEIGKRKSEVLDVCPTRARGVVLVDTTAGYGYGSIPEENSEPVSSTPPRTAPPGDMPDRSGEPVNWGRSSTRRLIGNGFAPKPSPTPPASILANVVLCPGCGKRRVLPELASMTGGWCWTCKEARS